MNEIELMQEDEINLCDLWEKLKNGWRQVLGGTLLGVFGAVSAVVLLPQKYEAVTLVQVGQVGQVEQVGQSGKDGQTASVPVEPAAQAVERMKTPKFRLNVAEAIGNKQWLEDLVGSAATNSKYMSLQVVKATATPGVAPLIELKTRAQSTEEARKIADGVIKELAKRHEELAKPLVDKMRRELVIAKEQLTSAEHEFDAINKLVNSTAVKDERFSQLALMTDIRVKKQSEIFSQRQVIVALETALGRPFTQPTEALEEIYVYDKSVSPKKTLILGLGLIGGLLFGVVMVFFSGAWRKSKRQRSSSQSV